MSRCSVCDFFEGGECQNDTIAFIPRLSRGNKVKWNNKHNAFVCLNCTSDIHITNIDLKVALGERVYDEPVS